MLIALRYAEKEDWISDYDNGDDDYHIIMSYHDYHIIIRVMIIALRYAGNTQKRRLDF